VFQIELIVTRVSGKSATGRNGALETGQKPVGTVVQRKGGRTSLGEVEHKEF